MYQDKPEQAKTLYSSMKCLRAADVAEAFVCALSAPVHVDTNEIFIKPVEQSFLIRSVM